MSSAVSFEYQIHKESNVELNLSDNNEYANYGGGGNDYSSYGNSNINYTSNFTQMDSASIIPAFPSRNEDLKSMLESNKDGPKVEAMKRLIAMIAKGRASSDTAARELFPHVVKNVVTKNAELKKLVYLYLTRYAEQEQDLALLSISSFQRSLKDPNPLIRASALRVLSSIRVPMISPIMLIAIKDCSNDMSAYVRKTAAHAISKLFHLDPDLKDEIISVIARLLQDKTSLVLGSAVAAFEDICPDRFDLIHSNYRKFVSLMPDFDEWGQVILINMLIRYGRTQFLNPNREEAEEVKDSDDISGLISLDPDHRLLLRNAKPLLQSRNSAVVMAVVQLYLALAPDSEVNTLIVKPLIRLLHSHPEIQIIVLSNIVTLTGPCKPENGTSRSMKPLFEPYLKSFFIKSRDSTQIKILKLSILTNLSSSSNIPLILREFQAYIHNYQADMEFVSATIQAIGRCASRIKEVAPVCLNGLISLLSNRNEAIVAQSIIVIRTQIIRKEKEKEKEKEVGKESTEEVKEEDDDEDELENSIDSITKADSIVTMIIKQVIRLIDKIETPHARATILWILAEFCDKNDKSLEVSPDVMRIIAKTFCNESNLVKLQAMNLASKLYLMVIASDCEVFNEKEKTRIKALVNYVFNLAKYDVNYDVRDKGRFLKGLINACETEEGKKLTKRILMSPKVSLQSDQTESFVEYSSKFRIGTLSHFLDKKVSGYEELPDFPTEQPDTSVRHKPVSEEPPPPVLLKNENNFFTDSSYSDEDDEEDDDDDDDEDDDDDDDEEEDDDDDDEDDDDDDDEEEEESDDGEEEEEEEEDEGDDDDDDDEYNEADDGDKAGVEDGDKDAIKGADKGSVKESDNVGENIGNKLDKDI
ncbi:AP-3 complex subunit beta-2 [Tetranychus urticae]|uniref:Clathrin/coatomer adaptor adaptin-like N-terminal domain-containing protein n=1 Tax=Tetranychus urticae TaxID=32264 RepID=T1JV66_TETUR|nr:AP-3 complex subunit beta-2 [Tetranychus urticae]